MATGVNSPLGPVRQQRPANSLTRRLLRINIQRQRDFQVVSFRAPALRSNGRLREDRKFRAGCGRPNWRGGNRSARPASTGNRARECQRRQHAHRQRCMAPKNTCKGTRRLSLRTVLPDMDIQHTTDPTDLPAIIQSRQKALTVLELAELLSLCPKQVYALIKRGSLPSYHIASSLRLDPKTTADWLRGQTAPTNGQAPVRRESEEKVRRHNSEEVTNG